MCHIILCYNVCMKIFLKLICVFLLCFVSLSVSAKENLYNCDAVKSVPAFVYVADNETENSISSSNYYNAQIILLNTHKQTYNCLNLYKASAQSKFLAQIFAQKYNRSYLSKSHKISFLLKNEINTRAP